ncbi:hypothetical protein RRG08_044688 [Elysia crispata]|uniref:Uncharacterized protein n=1 Tax=Elysia crispata TaxID=231223 RepID=A0AAE0ZZE0_9GAST|nr:hypothetical protein RRG08_044688 [Elysia crispata]
MEVLILRHRNGMKASAGSDSPKTGVAGTSVELLVGSGCVCQHPTIYIHLVLDLLAAAGMYFCPEYILV